MSSLFEIERLKDGILIYDSEETDVWHGLKYPSGDAYGRAYLFGGYLGDHVDLAFHPSGDGRLSLIQNGKIIKEIPIERFWAEETPDIKVLYRIVDSITDFFKLPRLKPLSPRKLKDLFAELKREASKPYHEFPGPEIKYGHVYTDDDGVYYKIVRLSRDAYEKMLREYGDRILTEPEWRSLGIDQMPEWKHIFSDMRSYSLIFRV